MAVLPAAPACPPPPPCLPAEQMNLAFAQHEIISDHLTACLAWLEAQGTVPIGVFERELYVSVMRCPKKASEHPDIDEYRTLEEPYINLLCF